MRLAYGKFILFIYYYTSGTFFKQFPIETRAAQARVCKTAGCIKAAQQILQNMDRSVKPCDNFYEFACGRYIKHVLSIKEDSLADSAVLGQSDDRLKSQLKEAIENKISKNADCRTLQLLQAHYNSCLDVEQTETSSLQILLDDIRRVGGWPVLDAESWDEDTFDWTDLIYKLGRMGYQSAMNSLIKIDVNIDQRNNSNYVIIDFQLDQTKTGLGYEFLSQGLQNQVVKQYYEHMVQVAKVLGASKRQAKEQLLGCLLFEIELAKIATPEQQRRNMSKLYNPMTLEELQRNYPVIAWKQFVSQLVGPPYVVQSTERLIVRNPNYLKSISKLIFETPKRVLANYIFWRMVAESTPYLNKKVQQLDFIQAGLPQWRQCVDYVMDYLPLAVGAVYVRKVFDRSIKNQGIHLVQNIRRSFENSLQKVHWMDAKTKTRALKKLQSLYAHVAYPDEILDDNKLDEIYQDLKPIPDNYFDSYLNVNRFNLQYTLANLGRACNKTYWVSHGESAVVNAFYEFWQNSIDIPAGFFQDELFAIDRPAYMNYAAIGYFIGHELTHAFDDEGSQYDEDGNLANWWDPKTQKEYLQRAKCIIEQYSNYTVKRVGMKINGFNTQGENIADNGGIKQAYFAYEHYEKQNGPEPRLPGLPYTPRQLFWLSNANMYCEKFRPEALKAFILVEEHCPSEFRVIGPLSNVPEFSRDFECPLGSFMNPVNKCTVV